MYGLDAIANANGWAMAITGACIVLTGLTILSLIISQLPKAVAYLEKENKGKTAKPPQPQAPQETVPSHLCPLDVDKLIPRFERLVSGLGESFELQELYKAGRENDCPHMHLSIRTLREAGILVPLSNGFFTWQPPQ